MYVSMMMESGLRNKQVRRYNEKIFSAFFATLPLKWQLRGLALYTVI